MGYLTEYKIRVFRKNGEELATTNNLVASKIANAVNRISGYEFYTLGETGLLAGYDQYKWYDYKVDMLEVSREFPNLVFCVAGSGEEQGDVWRHMFHNGKGLKKRAELVIPEIKLHELDKGGAF